MTRVLVTVLVAATAALGAAQGRDSMIEWPYVGGDQAHTKFSPADRITPANVDQLQIVWEWEPNEQPLPEYGTRPGSFETTPLMIDNVLYLSTMYTRVVALDAETGTELWAFDPRAYETGATGASPGGYKHRGIAVHGEGDDMRVFINSRVSLYALDARTGELITSFGDGGEVALTEGFPNEVSHDEFDQTSPPVVFEDLVIVGSRVPDRIQHRFDTPGSVQAFDVHTGERRWIFYTVPQSNDEFGAETWEDQSWRFTGHANAWGLLSLDDERGLLYVPTSTPSGDYWGGRRLGANLFAESLLCLDARTGERQWHFQGVHHGLWDYDFTSPPNLVTITVDGRTIDAVAEVSKQGFTYVFDRVTGEPVWPIEERPVPASTVPGEQAAPTQPFPTRPAAFDRQGVSNDDLLDFTPELAAEARRIASEYQLGPIYTPPILAGQDGLRALLMLPQMTGGANWQGGAVDAETGILYVASATAPTVAGLMNDPGRSTMDYVGGGGRRSARDARQGCGEIGPLGLPLIKPPWGRITAIDLNSGEHVWMIPNGDTPDCVRNHPALSGVDIPRTGKPERSGILVTKTLVFAGEGGGLFATPTWAGGEMFHAYDKQTGETIWEMELPKRQSGVPMTYMIDGKQYIAMAMSARGEPAELVALTLP
jgi:quinoprotein glucose dehydrogenase